MQRLGDSAMWLREDNLSSTNEIVLPYDEDLIQWERPSWIDSLIRLRWCCPAEEEKSEASPNVKQSKKKKKDKPLKQKKKGFERSRGVAPYPQTTHYSQHQQSHYTPHRHDVPPPPPLPLTGYRMDQYGYSGNNNGYAPYPNPQHAPVQSGYLTQQEVQDDDFFQPHHRHHQDLVYSIPNSVFLAQSTSSDSISTKTNDPHLLPHKFLPVATHEPLEQTKRDIQSTFQSENPEPMYAAEAAAATLKKHSDKLRHATASKNPNLPPLLIREPISPIHDASPTKGITTPQAKRGLRPRSVSPLATPRANSPQSISRPRFQSESSKRSILTSSTRHRRQAHESFQFSTGSLNQIAEKQEDVTKTAPPAYIECKTYHELNEERLSIRSLDESRRDDFSFDEDMNNQHGRPPHSRHLDFVSQSDDDEANALRSRNPNLPAISWINSFSAQGDAAAGNPTVPQKESRQKKIPRTKEIPAPAITGDGFRNSQYLGITMERPVFLPRSKALDRPIRKSKTTRIVISGWAAISLSDQLRNRLSMMEGPLQIQRSDLAYFQLIQSADPSKRPILRVKQDSGDHDIVLGDRYYHQVQSLDVCGRAGQCVCLMDASTRQIELTILPVSLPKYFFRDDKIVDEKYFGSWQAALFTPFTTGQPTTTSDQASWGPEVCLTQYAPDEQYDAALNVMFAIDTMLKVAKLPWSNWSLFAVAISG